MRVVADSGPLIALVDRSEAAHSLMVHLFVELGAHFLVPDPVIAETDHLLRRHVGMAVARSFLADVADRRLRREPLDHRTFARAVEIDQRYADLGLGIVDASVMAVAERERGAILTFDFRDFRATKPRRGRSWRLVIDERDLRRLT